MDCIFCRIINGQIPAEKVHEDVEFIAFHDIHPQAPVHILFVPKVHIPSVADLKSEHEGLIGRLLIFAATVAAKEGLAENGYRLTVNCGIDGGQIVPHLHLHLLAGRRLDDQMG